MNNKKILAIIIILALFFRLVSALIIPIFDKPDEKPHFDYIEFIVENKKLPVQKEGQHGEFFQPPFYHVFASFILASVKAFTQNIWYQVFSLRVLSIIVSMFTLYFIYKIASLLFSNHNFILGVVAFASFLPSYVNINSTITNANFGDLLSTLIIFIVLKTLTTEKNQKNVLLLGFIAGIAVITRLSIIPALLTIPFAFIIKYYPNIKTNIKRIIKPLAIIVGIALIISSWHLIRNFALYGDFLGINAMEMSYPPDETKPDFFIVRLLGWTFITFWASFGRTNGIFIGNLTSTTGIAVFAIFYLALFVILIIALYGLYSFLKKYIKNKDILNNMQKKAFIILIFHLALLALTFISFNLYDFQPQGRLFFPAIAAISIFFTLGIYHNLNQKYWEKFSAIYIASFILLNIMSFISIINNYY